MVGILSKNSLWTKFYDKIRKPAQKYSFSHLNDVALMSESSIVWKGEDIYIADLTKSLQWLQYLGRSASYS